MELPFDLAIPLLGLYPKNPETPIQNNLCTSMFTATQFIIAKCWKQTKCPTVNEWTKKLVLLHDGILCRRKKEGAPTFCDSMDELGSLMLSEISQVVKDKYCMIGPITGP